ncbi:MAG TPA: hypothetical protein VKU02_31710 [Gemmataceae bacterium]|nr:hypothetical protein [Gemmataceae bacterium]
MNYNGFPFNHGNIRGADSNTLLRMYDQATGAFNQSTSQQKRATANKAVQRIAKELQKRNVPL